MAKDSPILPPVAPATKEAIPDIPFGVNEVRLTSRQWLAAVGIILLILLFTPCLWTKVERFDTGPDYRIPYQLSKDYWLYSRRMAQVVDKDHIIVLGDSVVWGEYVSPDGTLSHFLDREAGTPGRFVNAGVNGLFPLAEEGLIDHYSQALRGQKVIVHCNVLWMTSPKADLSADKEESFNHSRLVRQGWPRIPCYKADAVERLSAIVEREVGFFGWVTHLQNAYFEQKSMPQWTLADDGAEPPHYPNAYKNPLAQITCAVPTAPKEDPQRGLKSPRHKPWSEDGKGTTQFEWVDTSASLQWRAFQKVIGTLRERGNDLLVVVGPFNEHMMTAENRVPFRKINGQISAWLAQNQIPFVTPEILPSALYADASHPLTDGYALLAKRLNENSHFQQWLKTSRP
jgi:hypothetical protein